MYKKFENIYNKIHFHTFWDNHESSIEYTSSKLLKVKFSLTYEFHDMISWNLFFNIFIEKNKYFYFPKKKRKKREKKKKKEKKKEDGGGGGRNLGGKTRPKSYPNSCRKQKKNSVCLS